MLNFKRHGVSIAVILSLLLAISADFAFADEKGYFFVNHPTSDPTKLRASASTTAEERGIVKQGDEFSYLGKKDGWYILKNHDGETVYCQKTDRFILSNRPTKHIIVKYPWDNKDNVCQLFVEISEDWRDAPIYVELTDVETDDPIYGFFAFASDGIIEDVYVAEGQYKLRYSTGDVWYGVEKLFNNDQKYPHTDILTFAVAQDGDKYYAETYNIVISRPAGDDPAADNAPTDEGANIKEY
ncbi:hypothetical protein AGMMS49992_33200 [Clostridia bacterium]|nr:hypothetical protein AGMMS49992_33200 [Clostridia bacterium]